MLGNSFTAVFRIKIVGNGRIEENSDSGEKYKYNQYGRQYFFHTVFLLFILLKKGAETARRPF